MNLDATPIQARKSNAVLEDRRNFADTVNAYISWRKNNEGLQVLAQR